MIILSQHLVPRDSVLPPNFAFWGTAKKFRRLSADPAPQTCTKSPPMIMSPLTITKLGLCPRPKPQAVTEQDAIG